VLNRRHCFDLTEEEIAISVNRHYFPHNKVSRFNWNWENLVRFDRRRTARSPAFTPGRTRQLVRLSDNRMSLPFTFIQWHGFVKTRFWLLYAIRQCHRRVLTPAGWYHEFPTWRQIVGASFHNDQEKRSKPQTGEQWNSPRTCREIITNTWYTEMISTKTTQ